MARLVEWGEFFFTKKLISSSYTWHYRSLPKWGAKTFFTDRCWGGALTFFHPLQNITSRGIFLWILPPPLAYVLPNKNGRRRPWLYISFSWWTHVQTYFFWHFELMTSYTTSRLQGSYTTLDFCSSFCSWYGLMTSNKENIAFDYDSFLVYDMHWRHIE